MTNRHLSAGLALVWGATLAGCGFSEPETAEQCIERFDKLLADGHPAARAALGAGRIQPIFTYDMSQIEGGLEELVGTAEQRAGMRMTLSQGAGTAEALDAFYKADVGPKGAMFAAGAITLFRIRGNPGALDETIVEGCRETRPNARLVHIHWAMMPPATDRQAETL